MKVFEIRSQLRKFQTIRAPRAGYGQTVTYHYFSGGQSGRPDIGRCL